MKKTLSIFLSFIMLLSITAGLNLTAYAGDPDLAPTISTNGTWVTDSRTTSDSTKFYKFTIPSDGRVTVKLMTYCYGTCIRVYDEDLTEDYLGWSASGDSTSPSTAEDSVDLSKGIYFIKVYSDYGSDKSYGKIKVQVNFESFNTNEKEPNDYNHAMVLNKGTLITGALTEQEDADWYKFTLTSSAKVTFNFKHYFYNPDAYLYNVDLSETIWDKSYCSRGDAVSPCTHSITEDLPAGTYYFQVHGGYTGKYSVKWTSACITHSYKTTITPATTKADGKIVKTCSACGAATTTAIPYAKTVFLSASSFTYNGKTKTPSVTVNDSKGLVIDPSNYTVSYSSGRKNVGQYTITVKFKGNYSGTVKKTFTIKPKSTSISKLTVGKKKFTIKWKKQTAQTTGYQIQYSTSSNFKGAKTVTVNKNKTTSKSVSKLKAKKKYYVRIRTYKTVKVNGKNTKIYSSWSKSKAVTTKK